MPYIATDLDAFDSAQGVAGATTLPIQHVLGGLALLWRWCWRQKSDLVTADQLAAHFGSHAEALPGALVAFGFLEGTSPYRVRGVERYLRISRVRSEAGKARAAGANRDPATGQLLTSKPLANAGEPASKPPASDQPLQRAASSEQRMSNSEDLAAGAAVPVESPEAPPTPAQKPRQRAQAPARSANGATPLVLEAQTPHEPDRARQELIAAICADFSATHDGAKYKPNERLDFKALDRMRKAHGDAEVLSRCRNGFRTKYGGAAYIWEVEQKWNKFATPGQTTKTAQERAAESRDTSRDWSTWDGEF